MRRLMFIAAKPKFFVEEQRNHEEWYFLIVGVAVAHEERVDLNWFVNIILYVSSACGEQSSRY